MSDKRTYIFKLTGEVEILDPTPPEPEPELPPDPDPIPPPDPDPNPTPDPDPTPPPTIDPPQNGDIQIPYGGKYTSPVQAIPSTGMPEFNGPTVTPTSIEALQQAVNTIEPGGTIDCRGQFFDFGNGGLILPEKSNPLQDYTRILCDEGTVFQGRRSNIISTQGRASYWRFQGPGTLRPEPGVFVWNLAFLGGSADEMKTRNEVPHHFIFDGFNVRGDPGVGCIRGLYINAEKVAVMNGEITDCKAPGNDTQAIVGGNGTKSLLIYNMLLEGAAENVMFGGVPAASAEMLPQDILIMKCRLDKPDEWYAEKADWSIKNVFELKAALRVHLYGCYLETNFVDSQSGQYWLGTPRTGKTVRDAAGNPIIRPDGTPLKTAPFTTVRDVLMEHCHSDSIASGINLFAFDSNGPGDAVQAQNFTFYNNLITRLGRYGHNQAALLQILQQVPNVTLDQITVRRDPENAGGNFIVSSNKAMTVTSDGNPAFGNNNEGPGHLNFTMRSVSADIGQYGIKGGGTGSGMPTLERDFPNAVFEDLHLHSPNGQESLYPDGFATWYDDPANLPDKHDQAALDAAMAVP